MTGIRIAVLASGSGTDLQSVIDACEAGRIDGRVVVV
ncbi:MAG TPA: phosphoribosylglycinamide formyltransferase, partial [Thermoplasmata archaeon]|nr:phosphoribosylglycinamide formyltransferase [Thermoplasmata archaeon]